MVWIMITPLHPESQKLSSIQIEKDTEQTIREQGETSLQEPVEGARELVTWTMELLTTLAIPLTAQTILPPSAYPNPETRKEVAAFDKWVKQTQSHLGSLNLGLRGCSLIFWSQLLGAKREVLANARTELSKFSKEDSSVKSALEKITSAEEVVRKEEQVYLEQKRSWGLRAFRQSLRITQPYLKELGRAASLTAIAKIANLAFQWTISSLGLLFSGQAFKKALSEWKIYKQGAADFERRLRFPQPTSPLTPQTQSVPNGTQIDEEAWLKKKIADKENIFKEKCNNIVKDWASQQQNIQEACELQKKSAIPEVGRVIFFKKCYTCSDDEASDLNIFFASDLRMDLSLKTPSKTLQSALAKLYVTHQYDQQQTRMHAVKNGLLEMVSAKQKMEGAFLKFADLAAKLDKLSAEATRQEQSLQELQAYFSGQKSLLASVPSVWPTRGWVTSDFGSRVDPYTSERVMHAGMDIAMLGVVRMSQLDLAEARTLIRRAGEATGWTVPEIRHNYGYVLSTLLAGREPGNLPRRIDRIRQQRLTRAAVGRCDGADTPAFDLAVVVVAVVVVVVRWWW